MPESAKSRSLEGPASQHKQADSPELVKRALAGLQKIPVISPGKHGAPHSSDVSQQIGSEYSFLEEKNK